MEDCSSTLIDFIEDQNLSYAIVVGKNKKGEAVAALYGNPDDFQVAGMSRYLYDMTGFKFDIALQDFRDKNSSDDDKSENW